MRAMPHACHQACHHAWHYACHHACHCSFSRRNAWSPCVLHHVGILIATMRVAMRATMRHATMRATMVMPPYVPPSLFWGNLWTFLFTNILYALTLSLARHWHYIKYILSVNLWSSPRDYPKQLFIEWHPEMRAIESHTYISGMQTVENKLSLLSKILYAIISR